MISDFAGLRSFSGDGGACAGDWRTSGGLFFRGERARPASSQRPGLRVLIVGACGADHETLADLLARDPAVGVVRHAADAAETLWQLHEAAADAAVVDIALAGFDGIALAKVLSGVVRPPEVVFVAHGPDRAVEAFEVGAIDYLVRPVREERLAESMRRVSQRLAAGRRRPRGWDGPGEGGPRSLVAVEVLDAPTAAATSSVRWLEACRDYVRVHADRGSELLNISMAELVDALAPIGMMRIHRSYAVLVSAVSELRKSGASYSVVVDGRELPISRRYASRVVDQLYSEAAQVLRRKAG
jgi:DNA-binding LytR/AlgR family response regulator